MRCPACQSENPDSARFCSKCGKGFYAHREEDPSTSPSVSGSFAARAAGPAAGSLFAARYEILEVLGSGGMGRVFRARDRQIDEEVAVKILRPEIARDPGVMERFRNELKLARKISHPAVCRVYHLGDEGGVPYITMEHVAGADLGALIRKTGRVEPAEALSVAIQVAAGLAEAHAAGVVHRDLKPQNVMVDAGGRARILDFGIAHYAGPGKGGETSSFIGTPEYMSPEQVDGRKIDGRSDLYSLGIILYEMLTGRPPFTGEAPLAVAIQQKTGIAPDPRELNPQIPGELRAVILRCLEKDPELRWRDADELLAELTAVEAKLFGDGGRPGAEGRRRWERAARAALTVLLVLVAVAGASAGAWLAAKRYVLPKKAYESFLSVDLFRQPPAGVRGDLLEFMLQRSIAAGTSLTILGRDDRRAYEREVRAKGGAVGEPVLAVSASAEEAGAGLRVTVTVTQEGRARARTFDGKGYADLLASVLPRIVRFVAEESGGRIATVQEGWGFQKVASGNLEAIERFLRGEEAWRKLDSNASYFEFRDAVGIDPDFSLALLMLADVALFRGDREEARAHLDAAMRHKERLTELDLTRLKALMARIDSRPAVERQYLRRLTEAFPYKKEYHYEMAESYFHGGDAEEAIRNYSRALELDPGYALAHNHVAYAYAWMGRHAEAEAHFRKYLEIDHTANSYDSLAAGYMFAGRHDDAIAALAKGIELSPSLDYLYRNAANNYFLEGKLAKAAEMAGRQLQVTQIETNRLGARFMLAWIEHARGNAEKGQKELAAAREGFGGAAWAGSLDESASAPFWLTGVIALDRGDAKTAAAMMKHLGDKVVAHGVSAVTYFPVYKFHLHLEVLDAVVRGRQDEALELIEEARRIKYKMGYWDSIFNLPFFFNEYAAALLGMGRLDLARELLDEAAAYDPGYAMTRINLARLALAKGDPGKAREEHAKATAILAQADAGYVLVSGPLADLARKLALTPSPKPQ